MIKINQTVKQTKKAKFINEAPRRFPTSMSVTKKEDLDP